MNQCIKCGKEIPDGELFCLECSLNPGSTVFEQAHSPDRHSAPKGRMQTPRPVRRPPAQAAPAEREPKKSRRRAMPVALALVSLLLIAVLGFQAWQYGSLQVEKNRLRAKDADLEARQSEMDDLQKQMADLLQQVADLETAVDMKDQDIQSLKSQLSSSQSDKTQGQYDLSTKEQELARLEEENQGLLALSDDLQERLDQLEEEQKALSADLAEAQTKANFMDSFVVFVEDDGTRNYHTYDCANFPKNNFWAYSRKLAEAQGFTPCPTCGGTP